MQISTKQSLDLPAHWDTSILTTSLTTNLIRLSAPLVTLEIMKEFMLAFQKEEAIDVQSLLRLAMTI